MSLSEICIRRPVFATVLSLIILLIGIVAYGRLTVREYPQVDEPVVSVTTTYPGASAALIESQITQVLEGSLAGIEGIDIIESTSRVRVEPHHHPLQVGRRISTRPPATCATASAACAAGCPTRWTSPIIAKVEADAQAIIYITFRSDQLNAIELTDYVDRYVVDRFKNLTGVSPTSTIYRRAPLCHAHLDRSRPARGLQSDRPGYRGRDPQRRTPRFRPGASKATSANSPCSRRPHSDARKNSATSC